MAVLFKFIYLIYLIYLIHLPNLPNLPNSFTYFANFIMWWFYLISLWGSFDGNCWVFLSVSLLYFVKKRAIFILKISMSVDRKSEMEAILNMYWKKWNTVYKQAILIFKTQIFLWFGIPFKTKVEHILGTCNFEQIVISRNLVC